MARRIRKISADCPKCGHQQEEPTDFISTICRGCGENYKRPAAARLIAVPRSFPQFFLDKLSIAPLFKRPPKQIHCYRCGRTHEVSAYAKTTICGRCNAHIHLEDLSIEAHASRAIDTRGNLHIGQNGYLNTTATYCSSATIQGRIAGLIVCEKTLTINSKGRCHARIEARTVVIDRDADIAFYFPIRASEIVIRGHATALISCSGEVRIKKGGRLDGNIRSRSFQVDKGGNFYGQLSVNAQNLPDEKSRSLQEEFPFLLPGVRSPQFNPDYAQT